MNESVRIKEISTNRYTIKMSEEGNKIYQVTTENKVTGDSTSTYYNDYLLADFAFESKLAALEGN